MEEEIQKRTDHYNYYRRLAKGLQDKALAAYNKFKSDHPELFKKKPVVDNKRKKTAVGKAQEKKQRKNTEDIEYQSGWESSSKIDSNEDSDNVSDYSGNKRKTKQANKKKSLKKNSHQRHEESDYGDFSGSEESGKRKDNRTRNTLKNAGVDIDGKSVPDDHHRRGSLDAADTTTDE